MISGMRWSFYVFPRRWKISSYKVDHHAKTPFQDDPKLCPCRSTDSESIILDPCRSTDSEFIILGPGRARAQNSSESQHFGVIKNWPLPNAQPRGIDWDIWMHFCLLFASGWCGQTHIANEFRVGEIFLLKVVDFHNLVTRKIKLSLLPHHSSSEESFPSQIML